MGRVVFIRWEKLKQLNANGNMPVKKETKSMAWIDTYTHAHMYTSHIPFKEPASTYCVL